MIGSLILRVSARYLLWAALALAVFVLLRGHNEPGGGFIGGLIGALGFGFHALAHGGRETRRILRLDPIAWAGIGLLLATGAGLPALLVHGEPFLTQQWLGATPIGTTVAFDLGVFLVVVGFALAFLLPFLED
ncbi:MnhB domain-containing protein [Crenalkalicoccus roseus]|uniref:MnhB domain-containing protein n=1 Tax=Crenalkalicoccus roseus TaxID=1485588 RepID=UPI00107FD684|nr:MnhB domain-containing protein [Crenalkalicoccus roseus]